MTPSFQVLSLRLASLRKGQKLWYVESSNASSQVLDAARPSGTEERPVEQKEKLGVMLLNLGGPERLKDVQPFLYNLFADPDIIRLPENLKFLQKPLATVISMTRARQSAQGYKAIGGGSPLRRITEDQGSALKAALQRKGKDAEVYVAMRYWHPYTEEAMEQVKSVLSLSALRGLWHRSRRTRLRNWWCCRCILNFQFQQAVPVYGCYRIFWRTIRISSPLNTQYGILPILIPWQYTVGR